jgi:flagellar basal body-associated protein FliL
MMSKNKLISIVLLFLVIILALGIGLFFSYKSIQTSKESFDNILKVPQENIPDLKILNSQLQSIYLYCSCQRRAVAY